MKKYLAIILCISLFFSVPEFYSLAVESSGESVKGIHEVTGGDPVSCIECGQNQGHADSCPYYVSPASTDATTDTSTTAQTTTACTCQAGEGEAHKITCDLFEFPACDCIPFLLVHQSNCAQVKICEEVKNMTTEEIVTIWNKLPFAWQLYTWLTFDADKKTELEGAGIADPEKSTFPEEPECSCGAENGIHAKDCPLYEEPELQLSEEVKENLDNFVSAMEALPSVEEVEAFEKAVDTFESANSVTALDAEFPEGAIENYHAAYETFAAAMGVEMAPEYPATELDNMLSEAFTTAANYYIEASSLYDGDLDCDLENNAVYGDSLEKMYALMEAKDGIYNSGIATFAVDDSNISTIPTIDTVANDNVEVHIFNYGAAINDTSIATNGMGWLPFVQPAATYNSTASGKYQHTEMDGTAEADSSNVPEMNTVLVNGFPSVKSNGTGSDGRYIRAGSLQYLFDTNQTFVEGSGSLTSYNLPEGVDYATPASYQSMHFAAKEGDSGLFKLENGKYVYNSAYNAAYFNRNTSKFEVYAATLVPSYVRDRTSASESNKGNFLPFNKFTTGTDGTAQIWSEAPNQPEINGNEVPAYTLYGNDITSRADVWFGMSVSLDFNMPKDGLLNGEQMIFNFLGDDDVWLYIDDVLVLDIGGRHGPLTGYINFASGEVVYQNESSSSEIHTTLKAQYEAAYNQLNDKTTEQAKKIKNIIDNGFSGNTFKKYTNHSFDFFYLERGGGVSNCQLEFNLDPLPKGNLTVTKEEENLNQALSGSYEFVLLDINGNPVKDAAYTIDSAEGKTDSDGKFTLKAGQTAAFTTVEVTKQYTVKEISTGNFKTTVTSTGIENADDKSGTVTISDSDIQAITFTNIWNVTELSITKKVVDKNNGLVSNTNATKDYSFELKIVDEPYTGKATINSRVVDITDGNFTLKDNETLIITGISDADDLNYSLTEAKPTPAAGFKYLEPIFNDVNKTFDVAVNYNINEVNSVTVTNTHVVLYGNLTIKKQLDAPAVEDQTFIFQITGTTEKDQENYSLTVTLALKKGEESAQVTVANIPNGTYTVTENGNWSWRYTLQSTTVKPKDGEESGGNTFILANETPEWEVDFTNSRTEDKWLSGDSYCENWWGGENSTVVERDKENKVITN